VAYSLSTAAKADLQEIWNYIDRESGSSDIADRQVVALTERFFLLAAHPQAGRARDDDLGPGRRSFPVGRYVIVYTITGEDVLILRVAHGRQDLQALMGR
jgi:toxin ParE1/3/4